MCIQDLVLLRGYLRDVLDVSASANIGFAPGNPSPEVSNDTAPVILNSDFSAANQLFYSNAILLVDNIAVSLSNAKRLSPKSTDTNILFKAVPTSVEGRVFTSTAFFGVGWAWLSLPAAVIFCAFTLLLVTMIVTRENKNTKDRLGTSKLWRTSSVALLAHGLETAEQERSLVTPGLKDWPVLDPLEKMRVQLKLGRQGDVKFVEIQ